MVGQYGRYLYAMFDVIDDIVVNRNENMLSIHKNDFLQIAMRDEFGQSISVVCQAHVTRRNRLNIQEVRSGVNKPNSIPRNL